MSEEGMTPIFISYSHADKPWLDKLLLGLGQYQLELSIWSDKQLEAGDVWREKINAAMTNAEVAVLLVSLNFLNSDFIKNVELPILCNAARSGRLTLIWIAVGNVDWDATALAEFQAANDPRKPLKSVLEPALEDEIIRICKKIRGAALFDSSDAGIYIKRGQLRGKYLHIMCDRTKQMKQFNRFFKPNLKRRAGRPQVYLTCGEAGQRHSSLVHRLLIEKIEPYAKLIEGELASSIHHLAPSWPDPEETPEELKITLQTNIFEEIDARYDPDNMSVLDICDHPKLSNFSYVIIEHTIEVAKWNERGRDLVEWYLSKYWAGVSPNTSRIQFLVFLNFVYPPSGGILQKLLFPYRQFSKDGFEQYLRGLSKQINELYPCLLFDELCYPDEEEVCRTLSELGFHDDEECPEWLKQLFRKKRGRVHMADIERTIKSSRRRPPDDTPFR